MTTYTGDITWLLFVAVWFEICIGHLCGIAILMIFCGVIDDLQK